MDDVITEYSTIILEGGKILSSIRVEATPTVYVENNDGLMLPMTNTLVNLVTIYIEILKALDETSLASVINYDNKLLIVKSFTVTAIDTE